MSEQTLSQQQAAAEVRRRKVRKGTHSCWECRRRKIRCQFGKGDDTVCLPCQTRGSVCRSQEFVDSQPPQVPDRRLAQRLARLEELMAKVVDRVLPEEGSGGQDHGSPALSDETYMTDDGGYGHSDVLGSTPVSEEAPVGMLLSLRTAVKSLQQPFSTLSLPPDNSHRAESTSGRGSGSRQEKVSRALYSLFPSQYDVQGIMKSSGAPYFMVSLFHSYQDIIEGRAESVEGMTVVPPLSSHPTVLAKRLLQLCMGIQQHSPNSHFLHGLQIKTKPYEHMLNIISTVSHQVISNDDIVGTAEGLQCLVLLGLWHCNAGNLRKAWLTFRRGISLGMLMGIDRNGARPLKFVDPSIPESARPSAEALWYRMIQSDRLLSLMLGLPDASPDNSFASDENMARATPAERLSKIHAVLARRIIERNLSQKQTDTFPISKEIDNDLESAARAMGAEWWIIPPLDAQDHAARVTCCAQLMLQIHHFDLRINLHLPYMLRNTNRSSDGEYETADSKTACAVSSREVLKRFVAFRSRFNSAWSCRHVDYSALVASMTLLMSYLGQAPEPRDCMGQQGDDRKLIEIVRERMLHLAVVNQDKLSQESADIIGQLLPILDVAEGVEAVDCDGNTARRLGGGSCLHLNVPYFGTVNIQPSFQINVQHHKEGYQGAGGRNGSIVAGPQQARGLPQGQQQGIPQMGYAAIDPAIHPQGHSHSHPHSVAHSPQPPGYHGLHMQFDQHPQEMGEIPLTAGADDWVFQGIESSYWNLLNSNGTL
ncbi:transcription factor sdnS [Podospora australis]|uniref:Transcription factor sdnS n=1 Tax=Podospora australis TaxID=1536484 RepID=A0AAN6WN90_9PEZI|nr:transcription factor sdnS [Podospora australis]